MKSTKANEKIIADIIAQRIQDELWLNKKVRSAQELIDSCEVNIKWS